MFHVRAHSSYDPSTVVGAALHVSYTQPRISRAVVQLDYKTSYGLTVSSSRPTVGWTREVKICQSRLFQERSQMWTSPLILIRSVREPVHYCPYHIGFLIRALPHDFYFSLCPFCRVQYRLNMRPSARDLLPTGRASSVSVQSRPRPMI